MSFMARSCGYLRISWAGLTASTPGEVLYNYSDALLQAGILREAHLERTGVNRSWGSVLEPAQDRAEMPSCGTGSTPRGRCRHTGPPEIPRWPVTAGPFDSPTEKSLDVAGPWKGMAMSEMVPCSRGNSQRKGLMAEGLPIALPAAGTTNPSLKADSGGAHSVHHSVITVVIIISLLTCELLETKGTRPGIDLCCLHCQFPPRAWSWEGPQWPRAHRANDHLSYTCCASCAMSIACNIEAGIITPL